jgi:L-alanine-DL-glutamate epimerase-like enolase superfamily enzyme
MHSKTTDIFVKDISLYFIPVLTRVPLKFGSETLDHVTCARAKITVEDRAGNCGFGWGETPLSVQWVWPSESEYVARHDALVQFCKLLANRWLDFNASGHPLEIGHEFIEKQLPQVRQTFNKGRQFEPMPHLAALVCASVFDQAIHDAYGNIHNIDIYNTYCSSFMNRDLKWFFDGHQQSEGAKSAFDGRYPDDYLVSEPQNRLPVWHLVGGLDPLVEIEKSGDEPLDGYPVVLEDWIERDGLKCLKIKLRGNDPTWDYERLVRIGEISIRYDVSSLTADFNCTVQDPQYVNDILDRLEKDHSEIYRRLLYVEQPFPYDLEAHRIDVTSVSQRKPLFLDESAHDWRFVRLGKSLGWTGVALKTCKTQTGALLSLCWAKQNQMPLMVQDLTNPMLAQIPHVRLAAHAGTIMGVESNGMQFYPRASLPEQAVHPGIYQRRNGVLDLSTISGSGFGYRVDEIERVLPEPVDYS